MSVSFFMGQVSGDPWANTDGRLKAPSGTPQYPSLLNGYPIASPPNARVRWPSSGTQAPWMVAGVDYAVGPNGTPSKIVGTDALPTGAGVGTVTGNSNIINVTGNNVTLDGWDFTQQGSGTAATGWAIDISGTGCVVKNCKFNVNAAGTQSVPPVKMETAATGTTIEYCTFDGGGTLSVNINGGTAILDTAGQGTLIQYNWLYRFTDNGYTPPFTGPVTVQYNLFDSGKYDDGSHGDFINSAHGTTNLTVAFNTFYQPAGTIAVSGGGFWPGAETCALQSGATAGFGNVTNLLVENNVCVGVGATGHRASSTLTSNPAIEYWFELQSTGGSGGFQNISPVVRNNYVTMSASTNAGTNYTVLIDTTVTGLAIAGNVSMDDGSAINGTVG